jgi:hypothetical protein
MRSRSTPHLRRRCGSFAERGQNLRSREIPTADGKPSSLKIATAVAQTPGVGGRDVSRDARSVPWPTDEEFCAVIAQTSRTGDRLILLALRLHDYNASCRGAMPGYERIAALTKLAGSYVRKRLAAMTKAGVLQTRSRGGNTSYTTYYIVGKPVVQLVPVHPLPVKAVDGGDDDAPIYDADGRPHPYLAQVASEMWGPRKAGRTA